MADRRTTTPPHHPLALFTSRAAGFHDSGPSPIDATPDADPERADAERRLVATVRGWLRAPARANAEQPARLASTRD